jgi:signal transduction histidine kinase
MNRSAGPLLTADVMRAVTAQAIVVLDADGGVVGCNDTALRLHGRAAGPDAATWPADGLYGPPLTGSAAGPPIGPLLHRLSSDGTWNGQVECRHTAGRTFTADMAVSRRSAGGFVLVYQTGAALPGGTLLSMLGHEMRSPLNGIIGLARMLLRRLSNGPPDPEAQVRHLTLLLTSASEMLHLTEQLADIARLQSGLARPDPAPIDCREAVTEAVRGRQPAATARELRLLVESPDQPVPLTCEAGLLVRLLHELIDNAVKYTDGAEVRIRMSAADPDTIVIDVANDGPAVPAGERTRIFGPFERGDAGAAYDGGGAGLGLYLARQLAHELGATVSLRDEDHPGTAFAVEIPRRLAPAAGPR